MISTRSTIFGYVRPLPRLKQQGQEKALREFGVDEHRLMVEGRDKENLEKLTAMLRPGDVVAVTRLHLLAPPRTKTSDKPRRQLWAAIRAISDRKATIIEVETGRSSAVLAERDDMVADAIEALTRAGRSQRKGGNGRPPVQFTDAQIEFALRTWYDLRIPTNEAAFAIIHRRIPKWSRSRCYKWKEKGFGPSGRSN